MSRRDIVKVICLVLVVLATGTTIVQGQVKGRPWKRGPLRLDDFGVATFDGKNASLLDYGINCHAEGLTEGGHTYLYCRTTAVMSPMSSWIAEGHRDDAELKYNQVLFDLVEVYRRQMQRQSYQLKSRRQYELLRVNTMAELDREIGVVQAVTDFGRDSLALELIRRKNREWLSENPGGRPEFVPRLAWWMVGVEAGFMFPTGGLADYYTASMGSSGLTFGYGFGPQGLFYHYSSGTVNALDSIERMYGPNQRTDISFGYGYTVLDRPTFSITPYLAYGLTSTSWWADDSYTLGVMGRYHFHHWHRITNGVKNKARCLTVSATGHLFATYTALGSTSDRKGLTIGLHLGLSYCSRAERVEW